MPNETDEVRLVRFSRPIEVSRSWESGVIFERRDGTTGILTPFSGLLDLQVKPNRRPSSALSYLVLRPLLIETTAETDRGRITRPIRDVGGGKDTDRPPEEETGERATTDSRSELLRSVTVRPTTIEAGSDRDGPINRSRSTVSTELRPEIHRILTSDPEWPPDRGSLSHEAASSPRGRKRTEAAANVRTIESERTGSRLSFLTLQSLVVGERSRPASRREDGRIRDPEPNAPRESGGDREPKVYQLLQREAQARSPPSTSDSRQAGRNVSPRTSEERFPRARTSGIERLRRSVTERRPGQRETASTERSFAAEQPMSFVEAARSERDDSVAALPEGRTETRSSDAGEPRTVLRESVASLVGREVTTMTGAGRLPTETVENRRSLLDSSTPRTELLEERTTGEMPRGERASDVTREAAVSSEERDPDVTREAAIYNEEPGMTLRRTPAGTADNGNAADRVREESGIESARNSGVQQRNRERQGDTLPIEATALEQVVDIDRFVDRLYRGLERKRRIERERRGL